MEDDDLVQAVQEFGAEMSANGLHHIGARGLVIVAGHELGAEVAGQDDDGVLEIHRAALPVRQTAVIKHLQQHVEHIAVRLLDFVEQDHLIGTPAHRFGEHAAFLITDITRRRADEAGHGMLLHELAHVDAHQRGVIVEQKGGKRLGELRLADARGAEEQERADGPVRVLQSGARAAHGIGDRLHSFVLADDAVFERGLHVEQLLALAFQHLVDRDAGPAGNDLRDILRRHRFVDERGLVLGIDLRDLLFELRDHAISQLACLCEIAAPLRDLNFGAGAVKLFLQRLDIGDGLLLLLPLGSEGSRFFLKLRQLVFQRDKAIF